MLVSRDLPLILVVEDDPNDRFFLKTAFAKANIGAEVVFAESAEEAISSLRAGLRPKIVITDLNMPGLGGFRLIEHIRATPAYHRLPVIVFSGSDDPDDIEAAYDLKANSYVAKPNNVTGYNEFANAFVTFWLNQNRAAA